MRYRAARDSVFGASNGGERDERVTATCEKDSVCSTRPATVRILLLPGFPAPPVTQFQLPASQRTVAQFIAGPQSPARPRLRWSESGGAQMSQQLNFSKDGCANTDF